MKINFLTKLLFFLTIISLILIFYKLYNVNAAGIYSFNNYYFYIPVVLFALSIISTLLSKTVNFYILYSITALLFSAYGLEIIYFAKDHNKEKKKFEYFKKNNLDHRERSEIYDEIIKKNLKITLSVPPQNFIKKNYPLFPLSGISNKKTIMCNESGYFNYYLSDRFGFNNNDDIYKKKNIHSVFIGDSFLHGACVKNKDNLVSNLQLSSFFKGKNILNLGYGGNGPLLSLATLREYFPKNKNIKYLFWIYYEGNDLNELNNEIMDKKLIKYVKNSEYSQNLRVKQAKIDNYVLKVLKENKKIGDQTDLFSVNNMFSILGLDRIRGLVYSKFDFSGEYKKNIKTINSFEKVASHIKNYTKNFGTKVVFIYIPSSFESEGKKYHNDILKIIKNNNITFLDLSNNKFIKDKKMYPKFGAHFNEDGYRVLSDKISLFMSKNY